ncbi:hypothetical protein [Marinobacter sp. P4B1]|uniref:hypothetical protein n=1 Tax=Marinobacter sp. P4B1 TaxID=1119533 RepID=UPI00071C4D3F|nr:hypothetical protein [Marinobacter sp. P4B1]KRW83699.1 hypothetical protein AQ621_16755 [Marinobacter sp. P4B1]
MHFIEYGQLPEALQHKIQDVAKARSHRVRRVTQEEADLIQSMIGWRDGWFLAPDKAQIVLETRPCGQNIVFRI